MKFSLSHFSFVACAYGVMSREPWPNECQVKYILLILILDLRGMRDANDTGEPKSLPFLDEDNYVVVGFTKQKS